MWPTVRDRNFRTAYKLKWSKKKKFHKCEASDKKKLTYERK